MTPMTRRVRGGADPGQRKELLVRLAGAVRASGPCLPGGLRPLSSHQQPVSETSAAIASLKGDVCDGAVNVVRSDPYLKGS